MPRKSRIEKRVPRKPKDTELAKFDNPDVIVQVERLAYEGFFDGEIADELNISRWAFREKKTTDEQFASLLENARMRAREDTPEFPSVAKFRKVWAECDGKRSELMKKFNVSWTTLQSWMAQEPAFVDIIAERDLPFLEQLDIAGRIVALGAVKGKDKFPGWSRYPDLWQARWYMNTLGKKYGYGENPVLPNTEDTDIPRNVENGIDIESWIKQEMTQKKTGEDTE